MYSAIFRFRSAALIKVVLLMLAGFSSVAVCAAQEDAVDETALATEDAQYVSISSHKMRAVVGKILRAEIAKFKGPKRIEIYDPGDGSSGFNDLDEAWLPKLAGVQFVLVSEAELRRRERFVPIKVFFFTKPKISEGRYTIGFAHGDPFCSYSGGDWTFNMIGAVRVVRMNSGFGAGCCNGSGN